MGAYLPAAATTRRTSSASTRCSRCCYERRAQLAGTLSGGEQQMVAMARALMSRPKLMLMDEPSMGLAPILVERNFEIIKQVHETGVAILVVEQNANVSLSIADRGYVLSTGRLVLGGQGGRPARRTKGCARPTSAARRIRSRRRLGAAIRGEFPIFAHTTYLNSCSQGALSHRVRARVRGVPRRLGRERRRVGALGRARRGGARGVRAAAARRAGRARRHDLRHAGRERDRLRARPAARGRRS